MSKIIKITCKGSGAMPLDDFINFQGNLKTLDKTEFEKLKRSILKYGFAFPVFVWRRHIFDGHQRIFVVLYLIAHEGYSIADIPIVEIQARDKTEAAEKLLLLNSHYAKITDDGLYEFLTENALDIGALSSDLTLPDIDMDHFLEGWVEDQAPIFEPGTEEEQGRLDELSPKMVKCPNCETVFDSRGHEQG